MCLKEAVHDTLTSYFTWWGYENKKDENKKAFSETLLVKAIFGMFPCINIHLY